MSLRVMVADDSSTMRKIIIRSLLAVGAESKFNTDAAFCAKTGIAATANIASTAFTNRIMDGFLTT